MTTETSVIIDSLEGYVLDIKPYHSKLSDIIVEYEFFDDVPVTVTEKHHISTLLNSIWSKDYISAPAGIVSKYELRAQFSSPTFFSCLNNSTGLDYTSSTFSNLGYKLFSTRYRKETRLVKKNNIAQLEGHDYFQTKGAYSFDILPDQKIIQTSHNTPTINWDDPDYTFSDGVNRLHDISNIKDAEATYKSSYEYNLGVLTVQTNSTFSEFKNFDVKFKSNTAGIIELALCYSPADGGAEIVRFDSNDFVTCLSGTLSLAYVVTADINFDIPVDTVLASFNIAPVIKTSGNIQVKLNLPNGFNTPVAQDDLIILRDTVHITDLPQLTIKTEFGNNLKQFQRWKFKRTNTFLDGTPTDKVVFNVFTSALSPTSWNPMGVQLFEDVTFSSSVLYNSGLPDLDVVDFTINLKDGQHVAVDEEFIIDADVVAASLGYTLTDENGVVIDTSPIDSNFDSVLTFAPYEIEVKTDSLVNTFSAIKISLKLSDLINQTNSIPSTLFAITDVEGVNTMNEISLTIRSYGTVPTFNVYDGDVRIGTAANYFNFNSQSIRFRPYISQLFTNIVTTLNYQQFKLVVRPNEKIIVNVNAPAETWSLVKINPVSYSRPRMTIANVADLIVSNLWVGTLTQDWIVTPITPTTFNITGSVSGLSPTIITMGDAPISVTIGGVHQFNAQILNPTGSNPYAPQVGDYYSFSIQNDVAFTPEFNLVFGYDIVNYDDPFYDSRFQHYDVNQLNFTMASDIPNSIIELRGIDSQTFSVKMFDKTQYYNGTRTELGTFPNATVDVFYSNQYFSFTIVQPTHPTDPQEFVENDVFFIGVVNPDPFVSDLPRFSSPHMPFVHMYGTSYVDLDPKRWTFTALAASSPTFSGASNPVSLFTSPNVLSNVAYDNSEVHFTFYPSETIQITPGDSFWFDIYDIKPSYKVFGSISGEQKMATVGQWYSNDKIAFILDKPYASVLSSFGTLGKRRVNVNPNISPMTVKLDNLNRAVTFSRAPRSDATFDVYKFKYISYSNTFAVSSTTGNKLGVDFSQSYEWSDRLNNAALSQNLNFDVKHSDFNLALSVLTNDPVTAAPISYPDGYEFRVEIIDHGFPLYHSYNGIMFDSIFATDSIFIDDLADDKIALQIDSNSLSVPLNGLTPVTKYIEANDNANNLLDSFGQPVDNRQSQWGLENVKFDGNKFYEIAMIPVRHQEYADVGTVDVDLYSANNPNLRIGKVRQKESLLRPVFEFDQNFVNSYFGQQGTKFAIKIEQGQLYNTVAAAKITESIKFTEKLSFGTTSDTVNVHITDALSFNSLWVGLRFYDNVNAHVADSTISNLYNYGGYDTLEYDNETNDLNAQLGGPNDIDNDGILDTSDVYTSQESKYDFGLKYAEQGLGVFGSEALKEPSSQDIRPHIGETFVIYTINTPTNFDEVPFDEVVLDSDASAEASVQMNPKQDASIDPNNPLFGKTYWNGSSNVPFTLSSYTPVIGENVPTNGTIADVKITSAVINHPFGTNITNILVVDNLTSVTEIGAAIEIINTNSFKITPSVPRTFAVIVV